MDVIRIIYELYTKNVYLCASLQSHITYHMNFINFICFTKSNTVLLYLERLLRTDAPLLVYISKFDWGIKAVELLFRLHNLHSFILYSNHIGVRKFRKFSRAILFNK